MAKTKIIEIVDLLQNKVKAKQQAYKATLETLTEIKKVLKGYEHNLNQQLHGLDKAIEVKYSDMGEYEAHIRLGGDTLVFMMHTNIFDFDVNHSIHKSKYVQSDPLAEHCGIIQVYNFLSDSLKYNRSGDTGFLVARFFINKDKHFFVEGKRPLNFLYADFEKQIISEKEINNIIEECILFALNFDLLVPPMEMTSIITVDQKNFYSYSLGAETSKTLGFKNSNSDDVS